MHLDTDSSLYEILDIKPDASPQEVREAYLRTKAAYNKDSVALYTLVSSEERERMLDRIEEAYDVLSNTDRRKEYDRRHSLLEIEPPQELPPHTPAGKIVSIDRVPPMEASDDALLVAPTTDFTQSPEPQVSPMPHVPPIQAEPPKAPSPPVAAVQPPVKPIEAAPPPPPREVPSQALPWTPPKAPPRPSETALAQAIADEVDWHGRFLKRIREARRISVEEMSNITKVSKNYIVAIEEESFTKLPAPVFLRGFVTQIAKVLKLPGDQIAQAYMAHYFESRSEKPDKTAK